jgi:hypothetical protein
MVEQHHFEHPDCDGGFITPSDWRSADPLTGWQASRYDKTARTTAILRGAMTTGNVIYLGTYQHLPDATEIELIRPGEPI